MAVDYGVPVEVYIEGLQTELANILGNTAEDKTHRSDVEAELKAAGNEPATTQPVTPVEVDGSSY